MDQPSAAQAPRDAIVAKIIAALPDAEVDLIDLTGTADHWQARIISDAFAGLALVKRHRLVHEALRQELRGPIHALSLETLTRAEAAAR